MTKPIIVGYDPRRADVQITHFGLAWAPHWQVPSATGQASLVPAYR